MIAAFWLPFRRALLCATATGSMYDVRHPGGRVGVLGDLVHVALGGNADPMSRNWRTPFAARNLTARPMNARLARPMSGAAGSTAAMARATSWAAR